MAAKRKAYRFTLDVDIHRDLIDFLESVPKVLRGGYCIEALKLLREKMGNDAQSQPSGQQPKTGIDLSRLLK